MTIKELKRTVSALAVCAIAGLSTTTKAEKLTDLNPYIGIDLQRTVYSYNGNYDIGGGLALDGDSVLEDALNGVSVHTGIRPHEHFGVELGYFRMREEGRSIAAGAAVGPGTIAAADFSTDVKTQGLTLDGLGYFLVGEAEKIELIGTAGLSWTRADIELNVPGSTTTSVDESEIGFRVGAGAQVRVTDSVNLRGLARYQTADFDDVADNAWTYSIGLNYGF